MKITTVGKKFTGFSVAAWIYPTELGTNIRYILKKGTYGDYALRVDDEGFLEFYVHDVNPKIVSGPIPPLYTWSYVVGTYDPNLDQISQIAHAFVEKAYSYGAMKVKWNELLTGLST